MAQFLANSLSNPHYLVVEPSQTEPYVGDIDMVLETVDAFDQASIWLVNPDRTLEPVYFESTDGDPYFLNWQVVLQESDEVVETIEYDPADPKDINKARRVVNVKGFGLN